MNEELKQYINPGKKNLIFIYVLYLLGTVFSWFTIIGGIFAYLNKEIDDPVWRSHYIFAFRTFLIGMVSYVVSVITTLILIGPIIYIITVVWVIARSIVALQYILQEVPYPDPLTFWIK